jgi:serine/threonine protein kinase
VRTIGKYKIWRILGRGGSSPLYEALDTIVGRHVALRTLDPRLAHDPAKRARFFEEAITAAQLRHPYIATLYDLGEHEGEPYVVMELVEGTDLETLIHSRAPRSMSWKIQVLTQICEGLAHGHRHGVLHLDVRPANVMVTPAGDAKIMAFGTAPLRPCDFTKAGLGAHEVAYVAPEQVEGGAPDRRADVFSVGVLAYELLCGRRPFVAPSVAAVLDTILHERPDPALLPRSQYSPRLEGIVMKALAREPAERHQTMDEACAELESLGFDTASLFFDRMSSEPEPASQEPPESAREQELQRLYSMALLQAADGRLEEALKLTRAIRRMAPRDPRNDEMMAYLGEMAGREAAAALVATALEHVALGNLVEARAAVEEALSLYPLEPRARMLRQRLDRLNSAPDRQQSTPPPSAAAPLEG